MSSENIADNTNRVAVTNEYPDMVGAKPSHPENAALARFRPYVAPETAMREMTLRALIVGTLLGMVFGASSLYLVLKVGLTVSASIPVAVIAIALFRLFSKFGFKNSTILENNIMQTAGSAGESLAFGVGVTMPAIMILGFDLEITRVMLVAVLGGLLGILMMIPLRRALIVQQHGRLKYPEGTACAEVLKAGASDESRAVRNDIVASDVTADDRDATRSGGKTILAGFGVGLIYTVLNKAFYGWKEAPQKVFGAPLREGNVGMEVSPALLGVGYIIGPRIAAIMAAGGVLADLMLTPMIKFFGQGMTTVLPPGRIPISEMDAGAIRSSYVLYIGAGAVAAGGIISLARSLPTIWHGLKSGLSDFQRGGQTADGARLPRTDQDLPMKWVIGGIVLLTILILAFRQLQMNLLGAIMIIAFGFLFVTVSSRLTGEIGSSSNPISGMTVATLLLTCLIFLLVGWTGPFYYVTALSVGAIVCIAASNGGTTSQDLKTGFLVGGTPRLQQIAILFGALASALILGPILLVLNDAGTVYVPRTTFEEVKAENRQTIDTSRLGALPAFVEDARPNAAGNYRLLSNTPTTSTNGASATQQQATQTTVPAGTAPTTGTQAVLPYPALAAGDYLVNEGGEVVYKVQRNFTADLRAPADQLHGEERLRGMQGSDDARAYRVWQRPGTATEPARKYLVDETGVPVYLVDPGINGTHRVRPDGTEATKFSAPKATLMSYIIQGILNRELPWGLVLLGVMIAVVLEMAGIPSLAFAVGVYLPLSASSPIFVGGLVRHFVDKYLRRKHAHKNLTEEELVAEGDKSPGVLLASGYIAGSAIAGIVIAFLAGVPWPRLIAFNKSMEGVAKNNPFFGGESADFLSLIPFAILAVLLYLVGRERLLANRRQS